MEGAALVGPGRGCIAIRGASDVHAEMWTEGSRLEKPPIGKANFILVYDGKLTGVIDLKTWWKVTEAQIEDVFEAGRPRTIGRIHHGRLAIEQVYGYMVFDKVVYGVISPFNSFVFMKRHIPGVLHMSLIPNTSTTQTIMKLLYYISHLCALDTDPHPELDSEGNELSLRSAPRSADKAPKIPDPNYVRPKRTTLATINLLETRRSPQFQDSPLYQNESLRLDIENLTSLGYKRWRGTLNTGLTVFAKLWDGWKFSTRYSEHEASVYYQLRDLWGTIIPEFLGLGNWGFCHILLLSFIQCRMLYQVEYNEKLANKVIKAFKKIHTRKVCHGDVRCKNILVRPDHSVAVIDFESSEVDADPDSLNTEMREVKYLLASSEHRVDVAS